MGNLIFAKQKYSWIFIPLSIHICAFSPCVPGTAEPNLCDSGWSSMHSYAAMGVRLTLWGYEMKTSVADQTLTSVILLSWWRDLIMTLVTGAETIMEAQQMGLHLTNSLSDAGQVKAKFWRAKTVSNFCFMGRWLGRAKAHSILQNSFGVDHINFRDVTGLDGSNWRTRPLKWKVVRNLVAQGPLTSDYSLDLIT